VKRQEYFSRHESSKIAFYAQKISRKSENKVSLEVVLFDFPVFSPPSYCSAANVSASHAENENFVRMSFTIERSTF
jgi:hypothetical protein